MPDASPQQRADRYFDGTAAYWRDVYQEQSVQGAIYRERSRRVLEWADRLLPVTAGEVLEIGSGAGILTVELARRGHRVHSIDSSSGMARLTNERAVAEGLTALIHADVGDAHALEFVDASFDLVVAVGVLPWLHDPQRAMLETARVLRPAGGLVATADNRARLNVLSEPRGHPLLAPIRRARQAWRQRLGKPLAGAVSRQHSRHQLLALLESAELRPIDGCTVGFGPFTWLGRPLVSDGRALALHRQLQALADRRVPLVRAAGWHHVVAARK